MSKRALILVEGQTEERFVKDVLRQYFEDRQLFISPKILVTKRVKDGPNFKGGVTSFAKFKKDAQPLLSSGGALVTTMLDYYGLPTDFPGMNSRPPQGTPLQRVTHVEQAVAKHFGAPPNFLPFLALHEFEAWLFSSRTELPRVLIMEAQQRKEFEAIRDSVATPEEINERPEFAPSKRIADLFPGYKKTLYGPMTAGRIGLEQIRKECPHFNDWMNKLEAFAAA